MNGILGRLLKSVFGLGNHLSSSITGKLALRLFSTPFAPSLSESQKALRQEGENILLMGAAERIETETGWVQSYYFAANESSPQKGIVVVVHGWSSAAVFMTAVVEPLQHAGFGVVLMDLPAHGASAGRVTNLPECAEALIAVAQRFGPVDALLAHSFGGAVCALATEGGPPLNRRLEVKRVILVASPNELTSVTAGFASALSLSEASQRFFEDRLANVLGRPLQSLNGNDMFSASGVPLTVLHCRTDREVPFEQGERYKMLGHQAQFIELLGVGHRRLLYNPDVIDHVVSAMINSEAAPASEFAGVN